MSGAGPILIGGTGRSGTTVLNRLLGAHRQIYAFPFETRFLIDPDGLMDLVDAFSRRYSRHQADVALHRFERMLLVHMCRPHGLPYPGFDLGRVFEPAFLRARVRALVDQLSYCAFEAEDYCSEPRWRAGAVDLLGRWPGLPGRWRLERTRLRATRYLPRPQIVELARGLVEDLFGHAAARHGKARWCEKTPSNLNHLDFLRELLPAAQVIHIKRDLRDVVCSLLSPVQRWAPSELEPACWFLRGFVDRWLDLRSTIVLEPSWYFELRVEDLVTAPQATIPRLLEFLGLEPDFSGAPELVPGRVGVWRRRLSAEQIEVCDRLLGDHNRALGYT
jgi:hypothetical protein